MSKIDDILDGYLDGSIEDKELVLDFFRQTSIDEGTDMVEDALIEFCFVAIEEKNDYEIVEEVCNILAEHHPDYLKGFEHHVVYHRLPYHLFHRNQDKVAHLVDCLIKDGLEKVDEPYLDILWHLINYQHTQETKAFIRHWYDSIIAYFEEWDEAIHVIEPLQSVLISPFIEGWLYQQTAEATLDIDALHTHLQAAPLQLSEEDSQYFKLGFSEEAPQVLGELLTDFATNKDAINKLLYVLFIRYMKDYNCSTTNSTMIWMAIQEYWLGKKTTKSRTYFSLANKDLDEFLGESFLAYLYDLDVPRHLVIWGSQYINDFLLEYGVIDTSLHQVNTSKIDDYKATFILKNERSLWQASFIHIWLPPPSVKEERHTKEAARFRDTKNLDPDEPTPYEILIQQQTDEWLKRIEEESQTQGNVKKLGRNQKVTVRYDDGRILKNVKYKKVMDDLESGRCELI